MKHIVIVLNGKGGVGKSFFSVQFVQYLQRQGHPPLGHRYRQRELHPDPHHSEARFVELSETRQLDGLFSATDSANWVFVDGRAASTDLFFSYFSEIGLTEVLAACSTTLTLAIPINHEADSVDQPHDATTCDTRTPETPFSNEEFGE